MKILVRFPNWLGDLVMSIGFYNKLREIFRDGKVFAIVRSEVGELLNLFGDFERIFYFSKDKYKGILGIIRFSKEIRNNYDIFFSLPNSFSSALMGFFSNSKKRIGYSNEFRDFLLTDAYKKPKNFHRVEEYCHLLKDFTKNPIGDIKVKLEIKPSEEISNLNSKYKILVNANSEAQSRRMSPDKWSRIINRILEEIDSYVILSGSKKDVERVEKIFEKIKRKDRVINLAGKTDLIELSKIIKACNAVLSSDSGVAHLSNALLVKTIVLFGAGNEYNTGPYNRECVKIIRLNNLECAPCLKNICKFGNPICLESLDENLIINSVISELLKI
jgi:lipopolysaccharide heptosyltransferase II